MENFLIFLAVVALIVYSVCKISAFFTLRGIRAELGEIRRKLDRLPWEFARQLPQSQEKPAVAKAPEPPKPAPAPTPPPPPKPAPVPTPPPASEPPKPQEKAAALACALGRALDRSEPVSNPVPKPMAIPRPIVPLPPPVPRKESEFERRAKEALAKIWSWIVVGEEFRPNHIAVEYAVATVWLVRSAVVLTLLALGFLVKYSHERNLVPPELRIAGIIASGLAILALGCKLSKSAKYRLLGLGLSGVGVVTLYFSIFAASSLYSLLSGMTAFALMILITVFAALLALRQNALLVALIAVIGGYATPVMLSTGEKRLPELFSYLLLIGAGSLFLAFYRNWRLLNIVAFAFSYALFLGAADKFFDPQQLADYRCVILFGSGYFVLFGLLPVCYSLIHRLQITLIETLLLFANTGLYFYLGISATQRALPGTKYAAAVTVFAALVFAVELFFCFRFKVRDRNLYLTLLSLCAFSVSLSLPLLLSSSWLTAAWAIQAAAMLYLGVHSRSRVLMLLGYLLYLVAGYHALQVLGHSLLSGGEYYAGLLKRAVSLGSYSLSLAAGFRIMNCAERKERSEVIAGNEPPLAAVESPVIAELLLYAGAILGFVLFRVEIVQLPATVPTLRLLLSALLYLAALAFLFRRSRFAKPAVLFNCMMLLMFAGLLDLIRIGYTARFDHYYPLSGFRLAGFVLFALGLAWIARSLFRKPEGTDAARTFGITAGTLWFAYSSVELYHGLRLKLPDFAQGGLSTLWAVYALILIVTGIGFRVRALRMTGLALFAVVALKALLIDMSQAQALYRIIAFFAVGLLLFVGAFAYMRMEQIFRRQEQPEQEDSHHE